MIFDISDAEFRKIFDDTSITVDLSTRRNISLVLSLGIPLCILALGAFVWIKRKRA